MDSACPLHICQVLGTPLGLRINEFFISSSGSQFILRSMACRVMGEFTNLILPCTLYLQVDAILNGVDVMFKLCTTSDNYIMCVSNEKLFENTLKVAYTGHHISPISLRCRTFCRNYLTKHLLCRTFLC